MTSSSSPDLPHLRFADGFAEKDGAVRWVLKRNCSLAPRQLLGFYLVLCGVCLGIATICLQQGAWPVMPFAGIELLAVGIGLIVYARHAADRESMVLQRGRFSVQCTLGNRSEVAEFVPAWVRIDRRDGHRSLIEVSGQGRRIAVGRFVRPEHRRALADELRLALLQFSLVDAPSPLNV